MFWIVSIKKEEKEPEKKAAVFIFLIFIVLGVFEM